MDIPWFLQLKYTSNPTLYQQTATALNAQAAATAKAKYLAQLDVYYDAQKYAAFNSAQALAAVTFGDANKTKSQLEAEAQDQYNKNVTAWNSDTNTAGTPYMGSTAAMIQMSRETTTPTFAYLHYGMSPSEWAAQQASTKPATPFVANVPTDYQASQVAAIVKAAGDAAITAGNVDSNGNPIVDPTKLNYSSIRGYEKYSAAQVVAMAKKYAEENGVNPIEYGVKQATGLTPLWYSFGGYDSNGSEIKIPHYEPIQIQVGPVSTTPYIPSGTLYKLNKGSYTPVAVNETGVDINKIYVKSDSGKYVKAYTSVTDNKGQTQYVAIGNTVDLGGNGNKSDLVTNNNGSVIKTYVMTTQVDAYSGVTKYDYVLNPELTGQKGGGADYTSKTVTESTVGENYLKQLAQKKGGADYTGLLVSETGEKTPLTSQKTGTTKEQDLANNFTMGNGYLTPATKSYAFEKSEGDWTPLGNFILTDGKEGTIYTNAKHGWELVDVYGLISASGNSSDSLPARTLVNAPLYNWGAGPGALISKGITSAPYVSLTQQAAGGAASKYYQSAQDVAAAAQQAWLTAQKQNAIQKSVYTTRAGYTPYTEIGGPAAQTLAKKIVSETGVSYEDAVGLAVEQLRQSATTYKSKQFYANELSHWEENLVEKSSGYHAWASETGEQQAANPYENAGDLALLALKGTTGRDAYNLTPITGDVSNLVPKGLGLQDYQWNLAKSQEQGKVNASILGVNYAPTINKLIQAEKEMGAYGYLFGGTQYVANAAKSAASSVYGAERPGYYAPETLGDTKTPDIAQNLIQTKGLTTYAAVGQALSQQRDSAIKAGNYIAANYFGNELQKWGEIPIEQMSDYHYQAVQSGKSWITNPYDIVASNALEFLKGEPKKASEITTPWTGLFAQYLPGTEKTKNAGIQETAWESALGILPVTKQPSYAAAVEALGAAEKYATGLPSGLATILTPTKSVAVEVTTSVSGNEPKDKWTGTYIEGTLGKTPTYQLIPGTAAYNIAHDMWGATLKDVKNGVYNINSAEGIAKNSKVGNGEYEYAGDYRKPDGTVVSRYINYSVGSYFDVGLEGVMTTKRASIIEGGSPGSIANIQLPSSRGSEYQATITPTAVASSVKKIGDIDGSTYKYIGYTNADKTPLYSPVKGSVTESFAFDAYGQVWSGGKLVIPTSAAGIATNPKMGNGEYQYVGEYQKADGTIVSRYINYKVGSYVDFGSEGVITQKQVAVIGGGSPGSISSIILPGTVLGLTGVPATSIPSGLSTLFGKAISTGINVEQTAVKLPGQALSATESLFGTYINPKTINEAANAPAETIKSGLSATESLFGTYINPKSIDQVANLPAETIKSGIYGAQNFIAKAQMPGVLEKSVASGLQNVYNLPSGLSALLPTGVNPWETRTEAQIETDEKSRLAAEAQTKTIKETEQKIESSIPLSGMISKIAPISGIYGTATGFLSGLQYGTEQQNADRLLNISITQLDNNQSNYNNVIDKLVSAKAISVTKDADGNVSSIKQLREFTADETKTYDTASSNYDLSISNYKSRLSSVETVQKKAEQESIFSGLKTYATAAEKTISEGTTKEKVEKSAGILAPLAVGGLTVLGTIGADKGVSGWQKRLESGVYETPELAVANTRGKGILAQLSGGISGLFGTEQTSTGKGAYGVTGLTVGGALTAGPAAVATIPLGITSLFTQILPAAEYAVKNPALAASQAPTVAGEMASQQIKEVEENPLKAGIPFALNLALLEPESTGKLLRVSPLGANKIVTATGPTVETLRGGVIGSEFGKAYRSLFNVEIPKTNIPESQLSLGQKVARLGETVSKPVTTRGFGYTFNINPYKGLSEELPVLGKLGDTRQIAYAAVKPAESTWLNPKWVRTEIQPAVKESVIDPITGIMTEREIKPAVSSLTPFTSAMGVVPEVNWLKPSSLVEPSMRRGINIGTPIGKEINPIRAIDQAQWWLAQKSPVWTGAGAPVELAQFIEKPGYVPTAEDAFIGATLMKQKFEKGAKFEQGAIASAYKTEITKATDAGKPVTLNMSEDQTKSLRSYYEKEITKALASDKVVTLTVGEEEPVTLTALNAKSTVTAAVDSEESTVLNISAAKTAVDVTIPDTVASTSAYTDNITAAVNAGKPVSVSASATQATNLRSFYDSQIADALSNGKTVMLSVDNSRGRLLTDNYLSELDAAIASGKNISLDISAVQTPVDITIAEPATRSLKLYKSMLNELNRAAKGFKPERINDPYIEIRKLSGGLIPKGHEAEFLNNIREVDPKGYLSGSLAIALQSYYKRIDIPEIDIITDKFEDMANKQGLFYAKYYKPDNVKIVMRDDSSEVWVKEVKKIKENVPEFGTKWIKRVDIHSQKYGMGWEEFGVKHTYKDLIEINGIKMMPLDALVARKLSTIMAYAPSEVTGELLLGAKEGKWKNIADDLAIINSRIFQSKMEHGLATYDLNPIVWGEQKRLTGVGKQISEMALTKSELSKEGIQEALKRAGYKEPKKGQESPLAGEAYKYDYAQGDYRTSYLPKILTGGVTKYIEKGTGTLGKTGTLTEKLVFGLPLAASPIQVTYGELTKGAQYQTEKVAMPESRLFGGKVRERSTMSGMQVSVVNPYKNIGSFLHENFGIGGSTAETRWEGVTPLVTRVTKLKTAEVTPIALGEMETMPGTVRDLMARRHPVKTEISKDTGMEVAAKMPPRTATTPSGLFTGESWTYLGTGDKGLHYVGGTLQPELEGMTGVAREILSGQKYERATPEIIEATQASALINQQKLSKLAEKYGIDLKSRTLSADLAKLDPAKSKQISTLIEQAKIYQNIISESEPAIGYAPSGRGMSIEEKGRVTKDQTRILEPIISAYVKADSLNAQTELNALTKQYGIDLNSKTLDADLAKLKPNVKNQISNLINRADASKYLQAQKGAIREAIKAQPSVFRDFEQVLTRIDSVPKGAEHEAAEIIKKYKLRGQGQITTVAFDKYGLTTTGDMDLAAGSQMINGKLYSAQEVADMASAELIEMYKKYAKVSPVMDQNGEIVNAAHYTSNTGKTYLIKQYVDQPLALNKTVELVDVTVDPKTGKPSPIKPGTAVDKAFSVHDIAFGEDLVWGLKSGANPARAKEFVIDGVVVQSPAEQLMNTISTDIYLTMNEKGEVYIGTKPAKTPRFGKSVADVIGHLESVNRQLAESKAIGAQAEIAQNKAFIAAIIKYAQNPNHPSIKIFKKGIPTSEGKVFGSAIEAFEKRQKKYVQPGEQHPLDATKLQIPGTHRTFTVGKEITNFLSKYKVPIVIGATAAVVTPIVAPQAITALQSWYGQDQSQSGKGTATNQILGMGYGGLGFGAMAGVIRFDSPEGMKLGLKSGNKDVYPAAPQKIAASMPKESEYLRIAKRSEIERQVLFPKITTYRSGERVIAPMPKEISDIIRQEPIEEYIKSATNTEKIIGKPEYPKISDTTTVSEIFGENYPKTEYFRPREVKEPVKLRGSKYLEPANPAENGKTYPRTKKPAYTESYPASVASYITNVSYAKTPAVYNEIARGYKPTDLYAKTTNYAKAGTPYTPVSYSEKIKYPEYTGFPDLTLYPEITPTPSGYPVSEPRIYYPKIDVTVGPPYEPYPPEKPPYLPYKIVDRVPYVPITPSITTITEIPYIKRRKKTKPESAKRKQKVVTPSHWEYFPGAEPSDVTAFIFGGGEEPKKKSQKGKKKTEEGNISDLLSSGQFTVNWKK